MAKKDRIEARTLKGAADYLPAEAAARQGVIRRIEAVFQLYGYAPVETPAIEYLDVLLGTGGEETNKELFRLKTPEDDDAALRFDHTVPFSRLIAQYPDRIKTPFRRYAIGPVYRADKPGPGRYRQFTQCDIDVAGTDVMAVDAELMAAACEVLTGLGATDFVLPINNRKLIDALLESCGITDTTKQKHVLRVIDKLAKVGLDNIRRELGGGRTDASGDPIPGVGLEEETIERILAFIGIEGATRGDTVDKLAQALPESKLTETALAEMRELDAYLTALGVSEDHARFVPSLARGLDYYTGPVFEITFPKVPEVGSCGGGGRYDGLVDRFLNRPVPAAGFSFGIERLMAALEKSGVSFDAAAHAQVLVVTMGKVDKAETLRVAQELRQAGLRTEAFFASKKKMQMGNQLAHADHYGIPVAVILGEEEVARGEVAVKDLREGKAQREGIDDRDAYREAGTAGQVTVKRTDMAKTVRGMLG